MVYILLLDKQAITYDHMFPMSINLIQSLKPKSVSYNFEQTAIKSIKYAFPNVYIHGCLINLSKI